LYEALIVAENDHVDVVVRSRLSSDKQVDRPAASDPPLKWRSRECLGDLSGRQRIPSA
jgi:hypothetical protein